MSAVASVTPSFLARLRGGALSIRAKILGVGFLATVLLVAVGAFAIAQLVSVRSDADRLAERADRGRRLADRPDGRDVGRPDERLRVRRGAARGEGRGPRGGRHGLRDPAHRCGRLQRDLHRDARARARGVGGLHRCARLLRHRRRRRHGGRWDRRRPHRVLGHPGRRRGDGGPEPHRAPRRDPGRGRGLDGRDRRPGRRHRGARLRPDRYRYRRRLAGRPAARLPDRARRGPVRHRGQAQRRRVGHRRPDGRAGGEVARRAR